MYWIKSLKCGFLNDKKKKQSTYLSKQKERDREKKDNVNAICASKYEQTKNKWMHGVFLLLPYTFK